MSRISRQFLRLNYEVWQTPGISRAWRRELFDRSYLLVTDIGGYDLPEIEGPYSGMYLSAYDELIEFVPWIPSASRLFRWMRHTERLAEYRCRRDLLGASALDLDASVVIQSERLI